MEQWNNEAMSVDIDVEEIREANRYRNISLNKIPYLAFIAKYAPYSAKEMCHLDGSTEVLVEWENILSSQKVKSLPDAVNVITASYAHAAKQSIEEFDVFKTTSKRRIKRFLDTLLDQKDCVKRFFQDGFSQLQTNDLIYVLRYWESGGFQSFCGNNYEKVNKIAPNFSVDIEGYVYDFVVGCLDDQINPQELSDL